MKRTKFLIPIFLVAIYLSPNALAKNNDTPGGSGTGTPGANKPAMQDSQGTPMGNGSGAMQGENMEDRDEKRQENMEQACERARERVQTRVLNYDENKAVHVANYQRVSEKLGEIVALFQSYDLDTSELEAAIANFDADVADYANHYNNFINSLKASEDLTCGQGDGQYKGQLDEARGYLQSSIQVRQQIRSQYLSEIRTIIQDLRSQLVDNLEEVEE